MAEVREWFVSAKFIAKALQQIEDDKKQGFICIVQNRQEKDPYADFIIYHTIAAPDEREEGGDG